MIKIEFKEAVPIMSQNNRKEATALYFNIPDINTRLIPFMHKEDIKSVTFGVPSELVPSREEVLAQLGISKEQDEEMQQKYKIEESKIIIRKPIMGRYP